MRICRKPIQPGNFFHLSCVIASKVTEIGRNSVVMYVSDQFIHRKLPLTDYRDPSTKLGFWVGRNLNTQKELFKFAKKEKVEI